MDLRKVKKLIELLEESAVAEIEIHEGEESVRISRASKVAAPQHTVIEVPAAMPASTPRAAAAGAALDPGGESGQKVADAITAPMVGTYYGASTPGGPPFTAVGKRVSRGEVLCIIEAMKVMNQIESDRDGVVRAILVENGQPVEYGQPLIVVS
jgi:acetyl-CoA carboxylase biotin carboxyl carrier protein